MNDETTDKQPCDHVWHELTDKIIEESGFSFGAIFGNQRLPSIYVVCDECGERSTASPIEGLKVAALPLLRDGFEVKDKDANADPLGGDR